MSLSESLKPANSLQRRPLRGGPAESRVTTVRTALFLPPRLPLDTWRKIGEKLSVIWDSSIWWQGDWLIYGQDRYPDRYQRAIEESGLDYQTLRNYAWVARRFPSERRRAELSLQHHAEVAALPEEAQDHWLDRAERERWSRNRLRQILRENYVGRRGLATGNMVVLRISSGRCARWARAAERRGQDLPSWVALVLDEAADRALKAGRFSA